MSFGPVVNYSKCQAFLEYSQGTVIDLFMRVDTMRSARNTAHCECPLNCSAVLVTVHRVLAGVRGWPSACGASRTNMYGVTNTEHFCTHIKQHSFALMNILPPKHS